MIAKSTKSSSMATAEAKREGSQSLEQSSEEATSEGKEGSQNLRGNLVCIAENATVYSSQLSHFPTVDRRCCEVSEQPSRGGQSLGPKEGVSEKER